MSGGSYDYLFCKSADDLQNMCHQIEAMADRLAGLGWAADAARETQELLLILRQQETRVNARIERLRDIWHDVEWWDSADSGPDELFKSLAEYRGDADRLKKYPAKGERGCYAIGNTRDRGWMCKYKDYHKGPHDFEECYAG